MSAGWQNKYIRSNKGKYYCQDPNTAQTKWLSKGCLTNAKINAKGCLTYLEGTKKRILKLLHLVTYLFYTYYLFYLFILLLTS